MNIKHISDIYYVNTMKPIYMTIHNIPNNTNNITFNINFQY